MVFFSVFDGEGGLRPDYPMWGCAAWGVKAQNFLDKIGTKTYF